MKLSTIRPEPRNRNYRSALLLVYCIFFIAGCIPKEKEMLQYQSDRGKRLVTENAMVSSAHPLASEAGLKMLETGGNAVDAAVATAFALNVVEPNMSGIGGGGTMLIWEQDQQAASYVDFYSAKRAETYRDIDYSRFEEGEFNLLSTGVPGTVKGLLQALERHGTLSRQQVMAPAIEYAVSGFPVYPTLAQFIRDNEEKLGRYEGAKKTFWPEGEPLQIGEILKQPELAETLQKISDGGAPAFYESDVTGAIVRVLNEAGNPVTPEDFTEFEPQWEKPPLCGTFKNYKVLSAPLPQTGVYIIQALNILENYDLKNEGLPTVSSKAFDILSSAMRLSIADRAEHVTDPNWEDIPVQGLISKEYANERSSQTGYGTVPEEVEYGMPPATAGSGSLPGCDEIYISSGEQSGRVYPRKDPDVLEAADPAYSSVRSQAEFFYYDEAEGTGETTHISAVDPDGNAVSLSTTLSPVFGSGAWVKGFILNSSGYNFQNIDTEEEWAGGHPYRIRASTISPTIILEGNEVRLVIGAPGGGRIPTAILQNIIYILEYELDPLDAVKMPRIFPASQNTNVQVERGFASGTLMEIREMGYRPQSLSGGYARLYLVSKQNGKLIGVADPRHDGEVRGF